MVRDRVLHLLWYLAMLVTMQLASCLVLLKIFTLCCFIVAAIFLESITICWFFFTITLRILISLCLKLISRTNWTIFIVEFRTLNLSIFLCSKSFIDKAMIFRRIFIVRFGRILLDPLDSAIRLRVLILVLIDFFLLCWPENLIIFINFFLWAMPLMSLIWLTGFFNGLRVLCNFMFWLKYLYIVKATGEFLFLLISVEFCSFGISTNRITLSYLVSFIISCRSISMRLLPLLKGNFAICFRLALIFFMDVEFRFFFFRSRVSLIF